METIVNFQQKTKEELTAELNALQLNYNSLKVSYEKTIESNRLNEIALSKLNKFSVELLNLTPLDKLEEVISKMIKEITGAKGAVFSSYNSDTKNLNVQHIELEPGLLEKVIAIVGKQVKKIQAPVSDEMYRLLTTEIIGLRKTLHEASFGSISQPVGSAIQKLLKIDRFIGIVYLIDGKMYGTTLLGMSKDQPDPPRQILENIIFLAAISLKRKKAEEAIKDSEDRFRILFEGAPDAIFLTDPESKKILDTNKAASSLLMKGYEEIVGMNHYELHPTQPPNYGQLTFSNQLIEPQFMSTTRPVESNVLRSDGVLVPVEITSQMILFKGQQVLMGSFRNITERKNAEGVMQQLLTELQTLIDNIQQGVLLENEDRNIRFSNKKFCDLFNIPTPGEIHGNCGIALSQKLQNEFADPASFLQTMEKRLSEQKTVLSEELCLADGRIFERDYIPVIIDGKNNRNYWIYRDITERKRAERSLIESETQISALLEAIPDMLFIQNARGIYIDYHAPKDAPLYIPPENFMGKGMHEVLPMELAREFEKVFVKAIHTKAIQNFEYSLYLENEIKYFESRTIAYQGNKILSLIRDITERKQTELQIQQQNLELKKLNEDKDRFMSILAHDLKSPFNSILGFLDLLSQNIHKYDLNKIEKLINTVQKSSSHFYQLLESLLLWARAQSGKMPFEPQKVCFSDICLEIIEDHRLNAEAKKIELNLSDNDDCIVLADIEMLKTVLRNLISNSIKFTNPGGTINISCKTNRDMVIINVSDNGIGISPDKIASLFNISANQTTTGTAGEHGTGLGLFLCRELIEKNKGKIWVESESEKGSIFRFTLPKYVE